MLTPDDVLGSLRAVFDPELGISIVDLGLIYGVDIQDAGKKVQIDMTMTSPMCPYAPQLLAAANAALTTLPGVEEAKVHLVWVPRWDPKEHASEEAKAQLGFW